MYFARHRHYHSRHSGSSLSGTTSEARQGQVGRGRDYGRSAMAKRAGALISPTPVPLAQYHTIRVRRQVFRLASLYTGTIFFELMILKLGRGRAAGDMLLLLVAEALEVGPRRARHLFSGRHLFSLLPRTGRLLARFRPPFSAERRRP